MRDPHNSRSIWKIIPNGIEWVNTCSRAPMSHVEASNQKQEASPVLNDYHLVNSQRQRFKNFASYTQMKNVHSCTVYNTLNRKSLILNVLY